MKVIIIGGFLGSGKTTALRNLGKHLVEKGHKIAIIVNEIGEVGVDGETISGGGLVTKELTSGCICCSLRISMEYTLQTLVEEYNPDTVIIEPTGIAFPMQIKEHIELMDVGDVSFAPVVSLVDASRINMEISQVPTFIANQIKESEIVCINKIDLVDMETVASVTRTVMQLNPDALVIEMSARRMDDKFHMFMDLLTGESQAEHMGADLNSIELSGVGSYSGEYILHADNLHADRVTTMLVHLLSSIKSELQKINPEFIGHVKMTLKFREGLIKANLTSSHGEPFVEILDEAGDGEQHLRFLSAVTLVPKDKLIVIVENSIRAVLEKEGIGFEKRMQQGQTPISL
ncbi:GTP-binding protein [Methanolobus chelungpuianus]|uniref:Cobalamin biosynthesis protein CobW n=1 Tax=Methanolobus chelungpuianus TaxID=502115 RepID=A0AAE3KW31_9EURY|nr:GTP-binding protein [Methanolobus chelungpuianus]MCQ6962016.1 cobalamin biosynthesis protein CobW [Methanolobus chelungpuianus]